MINAALVPTIPVDVLLDAYSEGRFPMCHEDGAMYWHDPDPRAIIQLDSARPNARLQRLMRSGRFEVSFDQAFEAVILACAQREETWIDDRLVASYSLLHEAGHAHSVEVWENAALVGGIYGVSLSGAFFGESMFNHVSNAGKVAFHALADHLRSRNFGLFDTQYVNDFTAQLGAQEVRRSTFRKMLAQALLVQTKF
jgi:leucyl/phenylalanyl-tRNA--protein transferase